MRSSKFYSSVIGLKVGQPLYLFENNNSYRNGFYYEYVIIKYTFIHIYKNLKIHNFFKNYIK